MLHVLQIDYKEQGWIVWYYVNVLFICKYYANKHTKRL